MTDYTLPAKEGYDFKGWGYVSMAWELFKKDAWSFIGAFVLAFLGSIILNYGLAAIGVNPIVILIITIVWYFVQISIYCGIYLFAENLRKGTQKFSDFFMGYRYIGKMILFYIFLILLLIPLYIGFVALIFPAAFFSEMIAGNFNTVGEDMLLHFADNMAMIGIVYLVFFLLIMYIALSYALVMPLMINAKMSVWRAMETSRKTVSKKIFSFFGFYITVGIAMFFAIILTLGFSLFIIYPVMFLLSFVMYEDIFNVYGSPENIIDSFGESAGDINSESQE